jgi:hypothetical protein
MSYSVCIYMILKSLVFVGLLFKCRFFLVIMETSLSDLYSKRKCVILKNLPKSSFF